MNYCVKHSALFFCLVLCISSIFFSCGLDEYYVLREIYDVKHTPDYNTDYDKNYFHFYTNDSENSSLSGGTFSYLGTVVYYKIYDNLSKVNSDKNSIESRNTSTSSDAAAYIINTLKYQRLAITDSVPEILVQGSSSNKSVYIRLTNYLNDPNWQPKIIIGYANDRTVPGDGLPLRCVQGQDKKYLSFDFGRKQTSENKIVLPNNDDEDSSISESASSEFYVVAYAMAVGRDETYTNYYSPVTYLGTIRIDSNSEDN